VPQASIILVPVFHVLPRKPILLQQIQTEHTVIFRQSVTPHPAKDLCKLKNSQYCRLSKKLSTIFIVFT
jgi:hypothetical protein